jgi:hypothetical protein
MAFLMRLFIFFLFPILIYSQELFIPKPFSDGQMIEQIILISDVDGVVRNSIEARADPQIIDAVKHLLKHDGFSVAFLSGTPIINDSSVEAWRQGNTSLSKVFGDSFFPELKEKRVAIYGVLGGHQMTENGEIDVIDEYSLDQVFELGCLLLHAFFQEVSVDGNDSQQEAAKQLQIQIHQLKLSDRQQSTALTPNEFAPIVQAIRDQLDPHFRLISNGSMVETHTSNPPWKANLADRWLRGEIQKPGYLVSHLHSSQKQIAMGLAKRNDQGFNFLLISKTNKGITVEKYLKDKLEAFPNALIVTIGDTQVDFPMHQHAHLAFHVGLEHVWEKSGLQQCIMVRSKEGQDSQHVSGTLQVLKMLQDGIGKSFYDLKYIPKQDVKGQWEWYSIRDLLDP